MKFKVGDIVCVHQQAYWPSGKCPAGYLRWFNEVKGLRAKIIEVDNSRDFQWKIDFLEGDINRDMRIMFSWCSDEELKLYDSSSELPEDA